MHIDDYELRGRSSRREHLDHMISEPTTSARDQNHFVSTALIKVPAFPLRADIAVIEGEVAEELVDAGGETEAEQPFECFDDGAELDFGQEIVAEWLEQALAKVVRAAEEDEEEGAREERLEGSFAGKGQWEEQLARGCAAVACRHPELVPGVVGERRINGMKIQKRNIFQASI